MQQTEHYILIPLRVTQQSRQDMRRLACGTTGSCILLSVCQCQQAQDPTLKPAAAAVEPLSFPAALRAAA